ncbi:hypothetical protein AQJ64_37025 [Streptomyces griseoruber]|uniref:Uncharacterized protein n=1 Tax=Streptomyces griseoruber TaxID=1943 RepID=A0A101SMP1_9ACTN|nr:hypothetical protein AQJ64_37025 [Streptomyces griseoruber]
MDYSELKADILRLIVGATEDPSVSSERRRSPLRCGRNCCAVRPRTNSPKRPAALTTACANVLTISAAELHDGLGGDL